MSALEVYTLAVGGPLVLVLLIVLGFCQAAKGRDYELEQADQWLESRGRHLSLVPPTEEDHRWDWPTWDASDLRPLASGVDVQKRTGGVDAPRSVTTRR